ESWGKVPRRVKHDHLEQTLWKRREATDSPGFLLDPMPPGGAGDPAQPGSVPFLPEPHRRPLHDLTPSPATPTAPRAPPPPAPAPNGKPFPFGRGRAFLQVRPPPGLGRRPFLLQEMRSRMATTRLSQAWPPYSTSRPVSTSSRLASFPRSSASGGSARKSLTW